MSMKFDDIDLNADVVPVEANSEVYGVDISAAETLMEPSIGQGQVGGSSIDGVVDDVRAFGEAKDSSERFRGIGESLRQEGVAGGLGNGGLDEVMESVDRESAKVGNVLSSRICDDSKGKEGGEIATNDGDIDSGLKNGVSRLGFEVEENCRTALMVPSVDRDAESVSTRGEKEERNAQGAEKPFGEAEWEDRVMGVCDSEAGVSQHTGNGSNMINLVVDLNPHPGADGEWQSGDRIGNKRTKLIELSGDMDIPFSAGLADNAASLINGVDLNGNQDLAIKEQETDVGQLEHVDNKNVKPAALKSEYYGKECRTEKEGEFYASDIVWGKVRGHPWWPGQIFDPLASSEKAMKYFKKDSYLIAYFGDQTFAWNEAALIKPFRMHLSQMQKQSNLEAFCHAVNCALDEVSRRVEYGLACSCLPEEVYAKLKSQVIVNAGIREESSRRDGGDDFSSAVSFIPVNFVQYLKTLAQAPHDGTDRLEFVAARAQLLAFNRWKGYDQLPILNVLDGLLENDADFPVLEKEKGSDAVPGSKGNVQVPYGKGKSVTRESWKRKHISGDGLCPSKKERCMSDLMSESHSSLSNADNKSERRAGRKVTSLSSRSKRKAVDSNDSRMKSRKIHLSPGTVNEISSSPEKLLRIGERIRRVASPLAESTPIIKYGDKKSQKIISQNGGKSARSRFGVSHPSSEKSQRAKVIAADTPSDKMLSQLCLAARSPMKGHNFLISIVHFFSDFRNSFCLENSNSQMDTKSIEKVSGKQIGKKSSNSQTIEKVSGKQTGKRSSNSETIETSGFEGMEDSYWTDRIVQSNPEEQVLFEPETPVDKATTTFEPEAALDTSTNSDYKQETAIVDFESEAEKPAGQIDEKCNVYSPTALILNFTDLDSVPSVINLNKIFTRYGPLNESETEVLTKSKRAKVVFKRRSDAETAFSSAGKFSIFGPSLVSYRLNYSPTPRKASTPATKRNRKDATSVEGNAV